MSDIGRFLSSPLRTRTGRVALALFLLLAAGGGLAALWLHGLTSPPRRAGETTPDSVLLPYDEVPFLALDGTRLAGWFIAGRSGAPTLILCHDHGQDRSTLLNIAVPLQRLGYNLFLPDFRGHGHSEGTSTLGLAEKRDIHGALEFLATRPGIDHQRFGLFGIGMGAHAGILAAGDRRELRALALDSPYPDVQTLLARKLTSNEAVRRYLAPLPKLLFEIRFRSRVGDQSAREELPGLSDRNLLLVVARDDPNAVVVREMYDLVPEGRHADRNLLELPGTRRGELYAEHKLEYDAALARFFETYLPMDPSDSSPERVPVDDGASRASGRSRPTAEPRPGV